MTAELIRALEEQEGSEEAAARKIGMDPGAFGRHKRSGKPLPPLHAALAAQALGKAPLEGLLAAFVAERAHAGDERSVDYLQAITQSGDAERMARAAARFEESEPAPRRGAPTFEQIAAAAARWGAAHPVETGGDLSPRFSTVVKPSTRAFLESQAFAFGTSVAAVSGLILDAVASRSVDRDG